MKRIAHCLVVLFCLAGASAQAQQWLEVRSSHLSVISDGGTQKKPDRDPTLPQWRPKAGKAEESKAVEKEKEEIEPQTPPAPAMRSIRFLKGKLVKVDCSTRPGAVLKIVSGKQTMEMFTQDTSKLLLIGVDTFSCAWSDRKVSVNYRLKADGRGELVSLEVD